MFLMNYLLFMLMSLSLTISIIFPFMKHPLSMGIFLIIQTTMIALITGSMINMFWFSYILIISILSGALVLFIYMASIASNEKFKSPFKLNSLMMTMIMLTMATPLWVDQIEIKKIWSTNNLMGDELIFSLIKLFNEYNMTITILIISYLFLTMIVISYLVNTFEGPLRMKN